MAGDKKLPIVPIHMPGLNFLWKDRNLKLGLKTTLYTQEKNESKSKNIKKLNRKQ